MTPTDPVVEMRERAAMCAVKAAQMQIDIGTQDLRDFAYDIVAEIRALPLPKPPASLFRCGEFKLHTGKNSNWKIDCDALTDVDLETLAAMAVEKIGLVGNIESVPTGGDRFAMHLAKYSGVDGKLVIVDDVLTTGKSMEAQRRGRDAVGIVLFARGECPRWVTPIFTMTPPASAVVTDAMVEAASRAGYAKRVIGYALVGAHVVPWESLPEYQRELERAHYRAALEAAAGFPPPPPQEAGMTMTDNSPSPDFPNAAALIVAEIERLDRAALADSEGGGELSNGERKSHED